jgi:hypothetical protein
MRTKRLHPDLRLVLALVLVAAVLSAQAAQAKPKKSKTRQEATSKRSIMFDVGLSVTYDDNIINYSDADLDLYDSGSSQGKFAIASKDDWIIVPRISPRLRGNLLGDQLGWIDLGFSYYGYASNDIRRYSRLSLSARQHISPELYGEISYVFIPSYYYRNYLVGQDGDGNDIFREANFSKHNILIEVGYSITRTLSAMAAYNFQNKTYNREFKFRNLNVHGLQIGGDWRPGRPLRFWGSYIFERGFAKGADMPDSLLDVSYDSWSLTFGIRHYMNILDQIKPELFGSARLRGTLFQTDRFRQVFYYGREDANYLTRAGLAWWFPYRIRGTFEFAFAQKRAALPDIYPDPGRVPETTIELESKLNYKSNSITIGLSRQF